jgi:hypothetical protein
MTLWLNAKAPEIDRFRRGLKRQDEGANRIPEQREGEDRAATQTVGQPTKRQRADKHAGKARGDEAGKAVHIEQARGGRLEQTLLEQAGRHIGREEQVVEFEPGAERQQRDQLSRMPRRRQPVEPRGNRDGRRFRCDSHC